MPNTPRYAWPWPAGSDRVMDGDNAIGALAAAIEVTVGGYGDVLNAMVPANLTRATLPLTLSTAVQAIPGATLALTVAAQELALVFALYHFKVATAGVGLARGFIYVDDAARPGAAHFGPATTGEESVPFFSTASLAPGAHTIDLRASKTINAGAATVESAAAATHLVVIRFRQGVTLRDALGDALGDELDQVEPQ